MGRALTLLLGLWFTVVVAGPEFLHACPTHDSHGAAASADEISADQQVHAGHRGHSASATSAAAQHQASSHESSAPESTAGCSCLGQCCPSPAALAGAAPRLGELVAFATGDHGLPDYRYVPVAADHVLPFAQAPPVAA